MKLAAIGIAAACLLIGTPVLADGQALATKHACMACHKLDAKLVGPGVKEIAVKYKGDKTAEAKLIDKVKKGGSGVWGTIPMPPNAQVPDADIKAIVQWMLAVK